MYARRMRIVVVLALAVAFVMGAPRGALAADAWVPAAPQEKVLANGMRVIVQEDHRSPVVGMHLRYAVGTRDGTDGLPLIVARMMLHSTAHVEKGAYDRLLAASGARNLDWGVSLDTTTFSTTLPSNRHALALWLWSDQMGFFTPSRAAFDQAYALGMEDRAGRVVGVPMGAAEDLARRELYPEGHPYRVPVGLKETAVSHTLAEAKELHDRMFVPRNATLVLVGDVLAQDAFAEVEKYFGTIPGGERRSTKPVPLRPQRTRLDVAATIDREAVILYWVLPGITSADPRMDALAEVLGGPEARVLEWALSDKQGLTTSVRANFYPRAMGSVFKIQAGVARGHRTDEVVDAIYTFLEHLDANAFDPISVDVAKASVRMNDGTARETCIGRARLLASGEPEVDAARLEAADLLEVLRSEVLTGSSTALMFDNVTGAPMMGTLRARTVSP